MVNALLLFWRCLCVVVIVPYLHVLYSNANPNTEIQLANLKINQQSKSMLQIMAFQNKILLSCIKATMNEKQRAAAQQELTDLLPNKPLPSKFEKMQNEIHANIQIMDPGTSEEKENFQASRDFVGYFSQTLSTFGKLVDNSMKSVDDLARIENTNVFEKATCDDKPGINEFKYVVCMFVTLLSHIVWTTPM